MAQRVANSCFSCGSRFCRVSVASMRRMVRIQVGVSLSVGLVTSPPPPPSTGSLQLYRFFIITIQSASRHYNQGFSGYSAPLCTSFAMREIFNARPYQRWHALSPPRRNHDISLSSTLFSWPQHPRPHASAPFARSPPFLLSRPLG